MSAPLKSFEGPDVQRLLDQIRVELGPGAKIDGAQKIRVGGVMGFFAKEHYRVVVEVPATAPDENHVVTPAGVATPAAMATPVTTDVFSAMADATDDVNDVGAPFPASEDAAVEDAPVSESFATESFATESFDAESFDAESFDAVLTRVATTLDGDPVGAGPYGNGNGTYGAHAGTIDPAPQPEPVAVAAPEPEPAVAEDLTPDIASRAALFLAETAAPVNGSGAEVEDTVGGPLPDAERALGEALRRTGLDEAVVEAVIAGRHRGENLDASLLEALGSVTAAPAPPGLIGSLLVVVGSGASAKRLAVALAAEVGADSAEIPFASRDAGAHIHGTGRLLVRTVEEAAERAPGWRRSAPAVVVVDASLGCPERGWARSLIAALRPTAVWGVVEATAKTEDISSWAEALGGLDALALENLDATVSPASALGTGIAVARLDGQPARASRWVATIVDRVEPCT